MRGYLLSRFERLSGSTAKSLLLATCLFAAYHAYQGMYGVMSAFVFGFVVGAAFCLVRRLWPVALAHALYDVLLIVWG